MATSLLRAPRTYPIVQIIVVHALYPVSISGGSGSLAKFALVAPGQAAMFTPPFLKT